MTLSRNIDFEAVSNFRDLGGYQTRGGRLVAWRRLFRSAELRYMTRPDLDKLKKEIGLVSVIDLRRNSEIEQQGMGLLSEAKIKYYNFSLISDGGKTETNRRRYEGFANLGEFYLHLVRQKEVAETVVKALEVIAEPEGHPLVFHCYAGKDRTGIVAAIILSVLGISDEDIIEDYSLSASYSDVLIQRIKNDPKMAELAKDWPDYVVETAPESMSLLLSALRRDYGSVREWLKAQGVEPSLFNRLEKALLI